MFCWKTSWQRTIASCVIMMAMANTACRKTQEKASLFSIDSLVSSQANLLTDLKASLQKEAHLDTKSDTVIYAPADTSAWKKELEIFRQLETINKPVNLRNYQINNGLTDPASNLQVKEIYTTENLPVRYFRIFYHDTPDKLRKIEALYDDGNPLYKSGRILSMEFRPVDGKLLLTSYTIQGGQKMIMDDSVSFFIKGKISVKNNGEAKQRSIEGGGETNAE
jgi:hypothetical protein